MYEYRVERSLVKKRGDKRERTPPTDDLWPNDDEEAPASSTLKATKKAKAAAIEVAPESPTQTPAEELAPQDTSGEGEGDEGDTLIPLADAAAAADAAAKPQKGRNTMTAMAMKTKGIAVKTVKVPPVAFSGVNLPAPAANPSSSSSSSSARPATRQGGSSSSSSSSSGS